MKSKFAATTAVYGGTGKGIMAVIFLSILVALSQLSCRYDIVALSTALVQGEQNGITFSRPQLQHPADMFFSISGPDKSTIVYTTDGTIPTCAHQGSEQTVSGIIVQPLGIETTYHVLACYDGRQVTEVKRAVYLQLGARVEARGGNVSYGMVYANNGALAAFPSGTDDLGSATLAQKFLIAETEMTNDLAAAILQWAYDTGAILAMTSIHNEVNENAVFFGGQKLIDLADPLSRIIFDAASGAFSVESGYEKHPVVLVTWYGAVMFCNWLTEMTDGNTINLVYTGITDTWDQAATVQDTARSGYRLPESMEWEYAARYRGSDPTNALFHNNVYWTKGDSASGADGPYTDPAATELVAWYDMALSELQPVARKKKNYLALYDMSGNVWEWCFNGAANRTARGGSWSTIIANAHTLQIGNSTSAFIATNATGNIGLRLVRTVP